MASYDYVEWPNSNLVCCICRNPFTEPTITRTCSHTFCQTCIIQAIGHSPQCPVDRSPLDLDDLLPASNIIRNLVEELIVECPHRSEGCKHTCQRQLLASHLVENCRYTRVECSEDGCDESMRKVDTGNHSQTCIQRLVECDGCKEKVRFKNLESHYSECPVKEITCKFCRSTILRSDLAPHNTSCPDYVIPCTHAPNGCPWTGPRDNLPSSHLTVCPYESIKHFFPVHDARISRLTDENIVLKYRVEMLESIMQTMKREMQVVKMALGPWYRPDGGYSPVPIQTAVEGAAIPSADPQLAPPNPRRFSFGPDTILSPPMPEYAPDVNILAPYFPPETEEMGPYSRAVHRNDPPRLHNNNSFAHNRSMSMSTQHIQQQTPVAPINLSTTLEGSLASLRESVVALSASVDSLTRRNDIALRNETLRFNDEILTLRANMHGLRMQVHGIMMDRNAQVTGRSADTNEGRWPSDGRFYNHVHMPTSTTKL